MLRFFFEILQAHLPRAVCVHNPGPVLFLAGNFGHNFLVNPIQQGINLVHGSSSRKMVGVLPAPPRRLVDRSPLRGGPRVISSTMSLIRQSEAMNLTPSRCRVERQARPAASMEVTSVRST